MADNRTEKGWVSAASSLKKAALAIGDALVFKRLRPGFQDFQEIPGEVVRAEELRFEDTTPLEVNLVFGPRVDSPNFLTLLLQLTQKMTRKTFRGYASTFTAHLADEQLIDVKVSRPYYLRKDNKGVIRQVFVYEEAKDG